MIARSNPIDLATTKIQHIVEKEFNIKNGRNFRKEIKNILAVLRLEIENNQNDYIKKLEEQNKKFILVKSLLK